MKRALATLDCVVVGVEAGNGKRHGVLSDYTFAVRDKSSDRLVTIGKAYTGLTDAEIAEMTRWFEAHTVRHYGRFRQVEPSVVVEVAFDVIQRSNRHQSGFALRFPRIVRPAHGQEPDRDRHAGDGRSAAPRAPERRRVPGHGRGATLRERGRSGRPEPARRPRAAGGDSGRGSGSIGRRAHTPRSGPIPTVAAAGYSAAMLGNFSPIQSLPSRW